MTHSHEDPSLSPEAETFLENTSAPRIPLRLNRITVKLIRATSRRSAKARTEAARSAFVGQTDTEVIGTTRVELLRPSARASKDDYVVYIHGGAFIVGTPVDSIALLLSSSTGLPVYAVQYPLAPEARHPAALDTVIQAWADITASRPGRPHLVGVSAGGNLALCLAQHLLGQAGTLPTSLTLLTPWVDLHSGRGEAMVNEGIDPLIRWESLLDLAAAAYAGDVDLTNPSISPAHASWDGLDVPTLITTGTRDLFHADCLALAESMRAAGVPVEVDDAPGLWHAYQAQIELLEARDGMQRIADFIGGQSRRVK